MENVAHGRNVFIAGFAPDNFPQVVVPICHEAVSRDGAVAVQASAITDADINAAILAPPRSPPVQLSHNLKIVSAVSPRGYRTPVSIIPHVSMILDAKVRPQSSYKVKTTPETGSRTLSPMSERGGT